MKERECPETERRGCGGVTGTPGCVDDLPGELMAGRRGGVTRGGCVALDPSVTLRLVIGRRFGLAGGVFGAALQGCVPNVIHGHRGQTHYDSRNCSVAWNGMESGGGKSAGDPTTRVT